MAKLTKETFKNLESVISAFEDGATITALNREVYHLVCNNELTEEEFLSISHVISSAYAYYYN